MHFVCLWQETAGFSWVSLPWSSEAHNFLRIQVWFNSTFIEKTILSDSTKSFRKKKTLIISVLENYLGGTNKVFKMSILLVLGVWGKYLKHKNPMCQQVVWIKNIRMITFWHAAYERRSAWFCEKHSTELNSRLLGVTFTLVLGLCLIATSLQGWLPLPCTGNTHLPILGTCFGFEFQFGQF